MSRRPGRERPAATGPAIDGAAVAHGVSGIESVKERDESGPRTQVIGVRFRDSSRVHFFSAEGVPQKSGMWVVCTTARGQEAGRVVVAPKYIAMSQLGPDLKPIDRLLDDEDIARIEMQQEEASLVVRRADEMAQHHAYGIEPVSAEFAFDGTAIRISCRASDHSHFEDLRIRLAQEFGLDVHLLHLGTHGEQRLMGGLGKSGRTLSSRSRWPSDADHLKGMSNDQAPDASDVSGDDGRRLLALSSENERYKKVKQELPRLGQKIATPDGEGIVVSLRIMEQLVTVRLTDNPPQDKEYPAAELHCGPEQYA